MGGFINKFGAANNEGKGDLGKGSRFVSVVPNGYGYAHSSMTGAIAAALAINSPVFAMRLDAGAGGIRAYIDSVRLQYTTLVAFTVPVTAGRRLALYRGSGAATTGGAGVAIAVKKDTVFSPLSEFDLAQGGDIRIATTGALGVAGITWEAEPIAIMTLSHVGAAGNHAEAIFEFGAGKSAELVLQPGQVLGIRAPQAFDAAGTWQLGVNVQWREAVAYGA